MEKQMVLSNEPIHSNQENGIYSYRLTLLSESDKMRELWLPKEPEGLYSFSDGAEYNFLNIQAKEGQWVAICKKTAYFLEVPLQDSTEIKLRDATLLNISNDEKTYKLLVEKVTHQRSIFHNYNMLPELEISIGSHPDSDVYYQGPFVAQKHAVISRHNGTWAIKSFDETNGIYVNGEKKTECSLQLGDIVYIMGLKIIVGHSSLAINNGLSVVSVKPNILQEIPMFRNGYSYYHSEETRESNEVFFNRAPRKRRESDQTVITVEGPPMSMSQTQMPLMLRMGSSMVMGGAAALAGNFMTLITSVMFPFLSSKYTDAQRKEYEQLRVTKYTEYLDSKRMEILDAIKTEQRELNAKYPTLDQVVKTGRSERLWERRPGDSDFLHLRLGTGSRKLSAHIEYPARRFELESDELEDKMYQLVEKTYQVEDAPIVLPLMDAYVCGIHGHREQILSMVRSLMIQTAVYHSYDEVKMVFLLRQEELSKIDSLRYLPHVWDDMRSTRFVATNEAEAYAVGEYIKNQLGDEFNDKQEIQKLLKKRPYYIIFAMDKKLFDGHEVFKQFLQEDQNPGVSIIAAYEGLPKECQKIISLYGQGSNTCTTMGVDGGEDEIFSVEKLAEEQFCKTMNLLANTSLKQIDKVQAMPKMVTFLEMFKVGRIEQLNPLKRWRENNPVKSLAAPVGLGEDGSAFMLDLHEKRQGPHGLVAGMTGSGKSEFLITYILSMAVNYHPDEVAFVLIDYKGGGLADAFENPRTGVKLPHLAGTITNLDGASIQRSLMSIESELVRRQKVFSEVSKDFDEGSMNIYTYQKLYRAGKVSEPMPHLFIVSDEFAELKQQQPEFMDKLISAARIGRSLGVHLILATQKPSGVVNDQIRSNTKFRVCLRVQDRSDSQDMLKRPEAAELTDTGRFYLQVGYNEYFALGQSAWCGADYEPQDTVPVQRDDAVEFLDMTGQVVTKNKPKIKKTRSGMTQIGAVVKYLSDIAATQGVQATQLCKPSLDNLIDLEKLQQQYPNDHPMNVVLGMLDDPENQQQFPLTVDFENCTNMLIVGESGSGKTLLLQNILFSLSKNLSAEDFNFYILDYSSRTMKMFKSLPHCGAVLLEEDVESLDDFFGLINKTVAERKRLFSKLEVDSFDAARKIVKLPLILVAIDNYISINNSKIGEAHHYKMQSYLNNCANYGVKFILTCSHINEINSRIRQELGDRICLHVKDKYDYSDVLGCKVLYVPTEMPGRGLIKCNERPLEFQGAILCAGEEETERTKYIKNTIIQLCGQSTTVSAARHLPTRKDDAEYEDFALQFKRGRIPLGYSLKNNKPIALPFKQFSALSVYFGNQVSVLPATKNLLFAAKRDEMTVYIVKRKNGSCFDKIKDAQFAEMVRASTIFSADAASMIDLRNLLVDEISKRNAIIQNCCAEAGIVGDSDTIYKQTFNFLLQSTTPICLFIENFADFSDAIDKINTIVYDKMLKLMHKRNIYVVGCFEPEDNKRVENKIIYYGFNSQMNVLMLGGQFDKQDICLLPETTGMDKTFQYNAGLMHYQDKLHPIIMPCGEIAVETVDEDEQSIF